MKKRIFLSLLCLFLVYIYQTWPIVQSEEKIRTTMLKKFPLGTSKSIIWNYAQKVDPGLDGAYTDERSWRKNNDQSSSERIGNSRILASISNIGIIDVTIIWLFDTEDKLIEVYAWKTKDLP